VKKPFPSDIAPMSGINPAMLESKPAKGDEEAGPEQGPNAAEVHPVKGPAKSENQAEQEHYSSIRGSKLRQFQLLLGLATITSPSPPPSTSLCYRSSASTSRPRPRPSMSR